MPDNDMTVTGTDPSARAWELIRRGISRVDAGEYDAAMADFLEAERIARQAELRDLIAVSRINQGHASSMRGDSDAAIRLFQEAADLTRESGDVRRLGLALANLGFVLKAQERYADAAAAYSERLDLLGDEDVPARGRTCLERAVCLIELGENEQAFADLADAESAAIEAEDQSLRYLVRMNRASAYTRVGDLDAARVVLEQALDFARASGDPDDLQEALVALAQVCRRTGLARQADSLFAEVEDEYRQSDNKTALADALYWHGIVLRSMRRSDQALAAWREEEAIQRELQHEGHLAECLYAQADTLRLAGDQGAAEPLFREAQQLLESLNRTADLPGVLYAYGMSLREADRAAEALACADEALRVAEPVASSILERRALNLRAMALADLGEVADARASLEAAEAICEREEAHSAMVWTLARRGYVAACDGAEPDVVVQQLRQAHEYALDHGGLPAGGAAVRKIIREIGAHCGDPYTEPLAAFRREQLSELQTGPTAWMPRDPMVSAAESEKPDDTAIEEDDPSDLTPEE